ncbi:Gamma-aminobutyric acid receptor subunit epsilon [Folsomia candida]|uniref:Gamma-aminobutyric acid receptor subunit epsilon n=1 Tax=Folsomia candida TaxID=158441 RepID=A0A226DDE8_FOLCA|nr:Gamma-aminobutyric acid receptor subunit epsilon [Folsomia candida]
MSSKNIRLAFAEHQKLFRFFSKSPAQWDSQHGIVEYKWWRKERAVLYWHINFIIVIGVIYHSAFAYFVYQQLFRSLQGGQLFKIVVRCLLGVLTWYGSVMHAMTTLYGGAAAVGLNEMQRIEEALKKWNEENGIRRLEASRPTKSFDLEKITLIGIVRLFWVYFFLVVASNLFLGVDSLHTFLTDIATFLRLSFPAVVVLSALRAVIVIINVFEICSLFSFVILLFLSWLKIMDTILSILLDQSRRIFLSPKNNLGKIMYLVNTHIHLQLAYQAVARYQELGTIALMFVGLVVFISSNFATLRFYKFLPFVMFQYVDRVICTYLCRFQPEMVFY